MHPWYVCCPRHLACVAAVDWFGLLGRAGAVGGGGQFSSVMGGGMHACRQPAHSGPTATTTRPWPWAMTSAIVHDDTHDVCSHIEELTSSCHTNNVGLNTRVLYRICNQTAGHQEHPSSRQAADVHTHVDERKIAALLYITCNSKGGNCNPRPLSPTPVRVPALSCLSRPVGHTLVWLLCLLQSLTHAHQDPETDTLLAPGFCQRKTTADLLFLALLLPLPPPPPDVIP